MTHEHLTVVQDDSGSLTPAELGATARTCLPGADPALWERAEARRRGLVVPPAVYSLPPTQSRARRRKRR